MQLLVHILPTSRNQPFACKFKFALAEDRTQLETERRRESCHLLLVSCFNLESRSSSGLKLASIKGNNKQNQYVGFFLFLQKRISQTFPMLPLPLLMLLLLLLHLFAGQQQQVAIELQTAQYRSFLANNLWPVSSAERSFFSLFLSLHLSFLLVCIYNCCTSSVAATAASTTRCRTRTIFLSASSKFTRNIYLEFIFKFQNYASI